MKRVALYIFLITLVFSGCKKEEVVVEKKEIIKSVFVVKPKLEDEQKSRVFSATASSNKQVKLSFKVQGNLKYFKHQLGDEIKKGELIAKLDSKPYELRVSQIEYGLKEAKATLINAKSTYDRTKRLYVNQNASVSDIDNARAAYDAAKAKVNNVSKELEYAKLQLSYTKLYSPVEGYISTKYVQESENVAVGTPIILVSDKLVDEVTVQVPENYINRLKQNDLVKVVFDSLDKKEFSGKVWEISKFSSELSKNYTVVIKIENSSKLIKSGMSADVYFDFRQNEEGNVYLVPSNSILNDKKGYFVYVVSKADKNYQIKRKDVKVGTLTKKGYEVLNGLLEEDLVLKAGMSEVYENMEVTIGNLKSLGE